MSCNTPHYESTLGAAMAVTPNPTVHNVLQVLTRLHDDDPDYRFMALNDLRAMLVAGHAHFLAHDYAACAKVIDGLMGALVDSNSEVQNMAVRCIAPFVDKMNEAWYGPMIVALSSLKADDALDRSIPATAVREMLLALPRQVPGGARNLSASEAYTAVSKTLVPRLVGFNALAPTPSEAPKSMVGEDLDRGIDTNSLDLVAEVARCFGPVLQDAEIHALVKLALLVLQRPDASSILKKKAVVALAALAAYFKDAMLSSFVTDVVEKLRDSHLTANQQKLYIAVLGNMARVIPRKFGPNLKVLAPFVLSALRDDEDGMDVSDDEEDRDPEMDEVREASLVALEAFLASCAQDMRAFTNETIDAALRFLRYDPNLAQGEDASDDEDDRLEGEDFEEEDGYNEDEDASWKVRRCATKVLSTFITARSSDVLSDGALYDRLATALIARFKERESSVLSETLAVLALLVRVAREESVWTRDDVAAPRSRKRRRQGSDASMLDPASPSPMAVPEMSPQARLAKLSPAIVQGLSHLLKSGAPSTKEGAIVLLHEMVKTRREGLQQYLAQIVGPAIEASRVSNAPAWSGAAASVGHSLRIKALRLLGAIVTSHSAAAIAPSVDQIVEEVYLGLHDAYSKVAVEALAVAKGVIKALTASAPAASQHQHLITLYNVLISRATANDVDVDVRQSAIDVLGLLVGRTSGRPELMAPGRRQVALGLLAERLRSEVTRLSAARAIEEVSRCVASADELGPNWVCSVALELGTQLRKTSRPLRISSLGALRSIALNQPTRQQLDHATRAGLVPLLLPLLGDDDMQLTPPALTVLAVFVKDDKSMVTSELNRALCDVVVGAPSGNSLETLLGLVQAIGAAGVGASLMTSLCKDVGSKGRANVVGAVIGNLLVAGGASTGVTLGAFVDEVGSTQAERTRLALFVLGEAALRLGTSSPLRPTLFIDKFLHESPQTALAAAVALGRAGAGNVDEYVPVLVSYLHRRTAHTPLLLHSVKEILIHEGSKSRLRPYAKELWNSLLQVSQAETTMAIGSECIGRLAMLEPATYLPLLQACLSFGHLLGTLTL